MAVTVGASAPFSGIKKITVIVLFTALLFAGCMTQAPVAATPAGTAKATTNAAATKQAGQTGVAGAVQTLPLPPTSAGGVSLSAHTDPDYYFSVSRPSGWSVNVGEYILIRDDSDNGATNVKIKPLQLFGQYTAASASDIANWLVGKAKQQYQDFGLKSVRESSDKKFLELVAEYSENGVLKKGVLTVFVNTPYALLSVYEAPAGVFTAQEELLRAIASSYRQNNPPAPSAQASTQATPQSRMGTLQKATQEGGVTMALPQGWTVQVFPGCTGVFAADGAEKARTVIFLNGLHQSDPLPAGVSPETYLTQYMQQDFGTVSNVQIMKYEDADMSALTAGGKIAAKSMRASFDNSGTPSAGSFTIGTYDLGGIGTAVAYVYAVSSTAAEFDADGPVLLQMFDSIDYSQSSLGQCRESLGAAWEGAQKVSRSLSQNLEQSRRDSAARSQSGGMTRQERNDEILEKLSDVILDRDRVYNPDTNEVYEVSPNFYDYYDKNREKYDYSGMRQLAPGEWLQYAPLNGELRIR